MALTDNLRAYWKLEENAASTAVEEELNAFDGTANVNTNTISGAGKINNGFVLTGTQKVAVGLPLPINNNARSINLWFYMSSAEANNSYCLFRAGQNASTKDFSLALQKGAATTRFYLRRYNSDQSTVYVNNADILDGWHMLSLVYNGVSTGTDNTGGLKWYFDGNLIDKGSEKANTTFATTNPAQEIGYGGGYWAVYFKGKLDEIGIWSKELSAAEVTSLYNGGAGLTYPFTTTPTTLQLQVGDAWKQLGGYPQINIGDAWKTVAGMQVNIGDTWKKVF